MKYKVFLLSLLLSNQAYACEDFGIYSIEHPNVSKVKEEIYNLDATILEKSTLAAIASIETNHMEIDYPKCDNKTGDSCNVSIYKANLAELRDFKVSVDVSKFDTNTKYAHKIMLAGMRSMGRMEMLKHHRGGESIRGKVVDDYIYAIDKLTVVYSLIGLQTPIRYTICIPAI